MKGQDTRKVLPSWTTVKAKTAGKNGFPAQGCIASLYYRGLNESYGDYRQGIRVIGVQDLVIKD